MEEQGPHNNGRTVAFEYVNRAMKNDRISPHNARIIKRYMQVKIEESHEYFSVRLVAKTLVDFVEVLDIDITQVNRYRIADALKRIVGESNDYFKHRKISNVQDFVKYCIYADFIAIEKVSIDYVDSLEYRFNSDNHIRFHRDRINCEHCLCPTRSA